MTDFAWPNFPLTRFQMRIAPATKAYASPYTGQVQAVDMLSECFVIQADLAPDITLSQGLAIEAFFDRLKGAVNRIIVGNLRLLVNRGTMRGSPVLTSAVAQFANILPITTTAGATALVGDMLNAGGQLFRVLAAATADGSGHISVEVGPRVRAAAGIASGTAVVWNQPTTAFRLSSANPALDWHPGEFAAPSIELREDYQ